MAHDGGTETTKEKDPKLKVEHFTRTLRVGLKPHEIAERADRAAHVIVQRDQKEESRKAANTAAKSQIEELDAELRRVSTEIRDKATYIPVACERRYDYRLGRLLEVRTDTGDTIHERALTIEERQLELDVDQSRSGDEDVDDDDDEAPEAEAGETEASDESSGETQPEPELATSKSKRGGKAKVKNRKAAKS
jgi:hypothetical protein